MLHIFPYFLEIPAANFAQSLINSPKIFPANFRIGSAKAFTNSFVRLEQFSEFLLTEWSIDCAVAGQHFITKCLLCAHTWQYLLLGYWLR